MAAEFVLPAGLVPDAPPDPPLEEGYEVRWRDDEDPPHYDFWVQASVLRLGRILTEAFGVLPEQVHAVLEFRKAEREDERAAAAGDESAPSHERWVSPLVPRTKVLAVLDKFGVQILHDGTVGFGAYDPESALEVFLDDHKLLSLFAPGLDPFDAILRKHGVPAAEGFATVLDGDHDHLALAELPEVCPEPRREWLKRKRFDPEWFVPSIRRALRMRHEPTPAEDETAD